MSSTCLPPRTPGGFGQELTVCFTPWLSSEHPCPWSELFVLLAQSNMKICSHSSHLSKDPSLQWNSCGIRSAPMLIVNHTSSLLALMALNGGQCRALLLKPISHAQRFTSAAATSDDSIISNGGYQRLRGIQVLVQLDQAESLH